MIAFLSQLAHAHVAWADGPGWCVGIGAIIAVVLIGCWVEEQGIGRVKRQ